MAQRIQLRRGNKPNLPSASMLAGEPHVTFDRHTLHVAEDATTIFPVVPAIGDLNTLATVVGTDDLIMIHDESETGAQAKKMTFNAFKTALNIPEGSEDEKVAAADGGTSGYLWGTDGTDGILRTDGGPTAGALGVTLGTASDWITLDVRDLGIGTAKIADSAIENAKIAAEAISWSKLDVSGAPFDVAPDSLVGIRSPEGDFKFINELTSGFIADGAIIEAKLATGAVTNTKIAAGAVDTAELAAEAVTNAKLDPAALNVNATTFSGNGISTELDVAVIDGGTF